MRKSAFENYLNRQDYPPAELSPDMETATLSEPALSKEWLSPGEDDYWEHLSERSHMHISNLNPTDDQAINQVAAILIAAFHEHWPEAWPDIEAALEEVRESFGEDRISRVALDDNGIVSGWIGGIREYDGLVWELHPLVVDPARQGEGVGRALVADFEEQVRQRGGITVMLGSDDDDGMTTLAGVDLYPDPWRHIANIKNLKRHPYEFYLKQGYAIVGVVPDANGPGKPDILMAKRVRNY
jgi:aminoglycoside 6'-N-acetyltransferase I